MFTRRFIKYCSAFILLIYLAVLAKNILFKKGGPRYYKQYFTSEYKNYSVRSGWKKANTVPFATINLYKRGFERHNATAEYNLLGNFIGFIPFGFLWPLFLPWFRHGIKMLMAGFLLSLGFETVQLLTGLGVWDVDDLLLNTAGVVAGYIVFFIVMKICGLFTKEAVLPAGAGMG